jgi:hypothetical protein
MVRHVWHVWCARASNSQAEPPDWDILAQPDWDMASRLGYCGKCYIQIWFKDFNALGVLKSISHDIITCSFKPFAHKLYVKTTT